MEGLDVSLKHILLEKGARIGSSLYDCAMDLVERGKALKRGGDPCTKKSIGYTTSHGIPGGHRDKVPWNVRRCADHLLPALRAT